MGTKKIIGIVLLVVGVIVLILSLAADVLGLGNNPIFGIQQILGTIGGVIVAAVGLVLLLLKK